MDVHEYLAMMPPSAENRLTLCIANTRDTKGMAITTIACLALEFLETSAWLQLRDKMLDPARQFSHCLMLSAVSMCRVHFLHHWIITVDSTPGILRQLAGMASRSAL